MCVDLSKYAKINNICIYININEFVAIMKPLTLSISLQFYIPNGKIPFDNFKMSDKTI